MFNKSPRMLFWLALTVILMVLSLLFQSAALGNLISVTLYKAHLLALGGWGAEFAHLLRSFKGMASKRPEYLALLQQ